MKNELKRALDTNDDGRAFTEAVLLKASGALYRRRAAAERAGARGAAGAWGWLEEWARPWLVAALLIVAVAATLPLFQRAPLPAASAAMEPASEASVLTAPQPEDLLNVSLGN